MLFVFIQIYKIFSHFFIKVGLVCGIYTEYFELYDGIVDLQAFIINGLANTAKVKQ